MRQILCVLGAVLFVAVAGLFVANLREAMATCPGNDTCSWSPNPSSTVRTDTSFDTSGPTFYWAFRETPFVGTAVVANEAFQVNIDEVAYTPEYWFPETCTGNQQVRMTGTLEDDDPGTLTTKGYVTDSGSPPPYAESFHVLNINDS